MQYEETSNEYYARINERFDERSLQLRKIGFVYEHVDEYGIAVFVYRKRHFKVPYTLAAGYVLAADERMWEGRIAHFYTTFADALQQWADCNPTA